MSPIDATDAVTQLLWCFDFSLFCCVVLILVFPVFNVLHITHLFDLMHYIFIHISYLVDREIWNFWCSNNHPAQHRKDSRRCSCSNFHSSYGFLHDTSHSLSLTGIPSNQKASRHLIWLWSEFSWTCPWCNSKRGVPSPFTNCCFHWDRPPLLCIEKARWAWGESWYTSSKAISDALRERGITECCCLSCGCFGSRANCN